MSCQSGKPIRELAQEPEKIMAGACREVLVRWAERKRPSFRNLSLQDQRYLCPGGRWGLTRLGSWSVVRISGTRMLRLRCRRCPMPNISNMCRNSYPETLHTRSLNVLGVSSSASLSTCSLSDSSASLEHGSASSSSTTFFFVLEGAAGLLES